MPSIKIVLLALNFSFQSSVSSDRPSVCPDFVRWPEDESPFFLFPGSVFRIDFSAERNATSPTHLPGKSSKMFLKSSRGNQHLSDAQPLTKDYLEPFRDGSNCSKWSNCLACTSDLLCGWCSESRYGKLLSLDTFSCKIREVYTDEFLKMEIF